MVFNFDIIQYQLISVSTKEKEKEKKSAYYWDL